MKRLLTMIGAVAVAAGATLPATADTWTDPDTKIVWTYSVKNATSKTVSLGGGTEATPAMPTSTALDAANIPWQMDIDGETYKVTAFADKAFLGCTKLTGTLTIPSFVTVMGGHAFKNTGITRVASFGGVTKLGNAYCFESSKLASADFYNSSLVDAVFFKATYLAGTALMPKTYAPTSNMEFESTGVAGIVCPGPDTVSSGAQTYTSFNVKRFAQSATSCKLVFFGPNTKGNYLTDGTMLTGVSGCTVFVPANGYWKDLSTGGSDDNEVVYYGAGQALDIALDADARVVVATPTTEATLASVLKAAPYFDMDVRVNVPTVLEIGAGVVTEANAKWLTERSFCSLVFKVNKQSQLDALLSAIPSTVPFAINPADATETLTLPKGRVVYVRLSDEGRNGKYTPKINGLTVIVR